MSALEPLKVFIYEDTSPTWLARVEGADAAPIVQADVTSIAFSVRNRDVTATEHNNGALVVADVVFNALQTDALWTIDTEGYNFKWTLTPTELDQADEHQYLIEVVFTMVDASKIVIVLHLDQLNVGSLP